MLSFQRRPLQWLYSVRSWTVQFISFDLEAVVGLWELFMNLGKGWKYRYQRGAVPIWNCSSHGVDQWPSIMFHLGVPGHVRSHEPFAGRKQGTFHSGFNACAQARHLYTDLLYVHGLATCTLTYYMCTGSPLVHWLYVHRLATCTLTYYMCTGSPLVHWLYVHRLATCTLTYYMCTGSPLVQWLAVFTRNC